MPKTPRDLAVPGAAEVHAQNRETLDRLAWAIASADGFALFFAKCNLGTQREDLINSLEDRLQADGIPVARVRLDGTDDPLELLTSSAERDGVRAVFVEGMELLSADDPVRSALASLNLYRERYAEALRCPVVIWTTDIALSRFAEAAPDFFAWRSSVFEFRWPPPGTVDHHVLILGDAYDHKAWATPVPKRRQRLEELSGVLRELDHLPATEPNRRERADILDRMGNILQAISKWSEAVARHRDALAIRREVGDRDGEGRTLNDLGNAYLRLRRWERAIECYEESLRIKRDLGEPYGESATLNNLGAAYQGLGRWDEAAECYQQSLAISRDIGDRRPEATTLSNLGNVHQRLGLSHEAIECYEQSLAICRDLGDRHGEGQTLNNLGLAYRHLGRWGEALRCYEQARHLLRDFGDRDGEGDTLNNLGVAYRHLGRWGEAIERYEQALKIRRDLGDRPDEAGTLCNLGLVYDDLGRWHDATECYQQALKLFRDLGDRHGEARTLNNLGMVYDDLGRRDDAVKCYQQSLKAKRELGDRHGEGCTLDNLGVVYCHLGRWDEAIAYYEQALPIFRDCGERDDEAETLNNLGAVYAELARWDEAIECYEQSLAICRDLGDRDGLVPTLRNLALAHDATGHARKAPAFMAEALKWSLGLHETRVVDTTKQFVRMAKSIAGRADWQALTAFSKALTNEIQDAQQQGFATEEIEAAANQSLKVFEIIALVTEAEADPQHPAFAQARALARDLDAATDERYDLTAWLNDLPQPNQNTT